ncbi:unnamed protein product [Tilletia caries]|nr:unnamed protein product [Tilletia caries]
MPSRPPFRPAPSLKPSEAAAKAVVSNKTLSHLLPNYVARLPPPPPISDTIKALRKNYKFAAVCQFLFTFGDALLVGEEWNSQRLEDALDGKDSSYVPKLCIKVLQTLTLNRNIDTSNYIQTIQTQADKRAIRQLPISDTLKPRPPLGSDPFPALPSLAVAAPPVSAPAFAATAQEVDSANPQPTDEAEVGTAEPTAQLIAPVQLIRDVTTLPAADQVEILHTLCEWHMMDPDRLRKLLKSEEDSQSWRVEPIGWDALDNTYYLFDDNRLWIQRARPKKPRPAAPISTKALKNGKEKQKAAAVKKGAGRNGKGSSIAATKKRGRPSGDRRVTFESDAEDDDEDFDLGAEDEDGLRRPSSKKRGVATGGGRGRGRPRPVASTTTKPTGRRSRNSGGGSGLENSPAAADAAEGSSSLSGPRQLRTRNGPPPPYAYQTGLAAVPLARGIRASSRIRGGGPGGSGPFGEDGWQRIPEALLEIDESIREEDGLKKGRRRSSRNAGGDDDDEEFREEVEGDGEGDQEQDKEQVEGAAAGAGAEGDPMQQDEVQQTGSTEEAKGPVSGDGVKADSGDTVKVDDGDRADSEDAKMVDGDKVDGGDTTKVDGGDKDDGGDAKMVDAKDAEDQDEKPADVVAAPDEGVKEEAVASEEVKAEVEPKIEDVAQVTLNDKTSATEPTESVATPSKPTPSVKKDEEVSDEAEDDLSELSDLSDPDDSDAKGDSSDDGDTLTPLEELEDEEDEYEPVAADFVEFEALCVTKAEWEAFGSRFAGSRNKNEKALHAVLNDTILPRILEDFAEEERQRALEVVMASRKRSSRIASRDSEREDRERLEAARLEQEAKMAKLRDEEIARHNKERAEAEAAAAREERIREREERLAARERELIAKLEREEAERITAEREREMRVARRKAALDAGGDVSRSSSYDPEDGHAEGELNGGTAAATTTSAYGASISRRSIRGPASLGATADDRDELHEHGSSTPRSTEAYDDASDRACERPVAGTSSGAGPAGLFGIDATGTPGWRVNIRWAK